MNPILKIIHEYDIVSKNYAKYQKTFKEENKPALVMFFCLDIQLENYEKNHIDKMMKRVTIGNKTKIKLGKIKK